MESVEAVESALLLAGRNEGPRLLYTLHLERRLSRIAAERLVAEVWSAAEFPQRCLTQECWRELFTVAGFTINGQATSRSDQPVTLYRGSSKSHRRRWSWTSDQIVAERFAVMRDRQYATEAASVWVADVEPWRLFAINTDQRGENEYVIDTRGLKIAGLAFGAVADAVADRVARLRIAERGSALADSLRTEGVV